MIHPSRIQPLNARSIQDGRYVLYWMQASQRVECNHALEYAVGAANERNLPVVVGFGLTDQFPEANLRHYAFMLEGLEEVRKGLGRRGIRFVLMHRSPELAATGLAQEAALVVADRGYLRIQRQWRNHVAKNAPCAVVQVESDAVVPVETASPKEEYTAGTLRPKLQRILKGYLVPLKERPVRKDSLSLRLDAESEGDFTTLLKKMKIDRTVQPVKASRGGTARAIALAGGIHRKEDPPLRRSSQRPRPRLFLPPEPLPALRPDLAPRHRPSHRRRKINPCHGKGGFPGRAHRASRAQHELRLLQ